MWKFSCNTNRQTITHRLPLHNLPRKHLTIPLRRFSCSNSAWYEKKAKTKENNLLWNICLGKEKLFYCQHKQNKSKRYQISPNSLTHAGSRHKQKKHIYIYIFVAFFLFPLPSHKRKHDLVHTLFTKKNSFGHYVHEHQQKEGQLLSFSKNKQTTQKQT